MTDIVERLRRAYRDRNTSLACSSINEAADEIERLREALLQCKDGLETLDRMTGSPADGLSAKEYWAVMLSMGSIIERLLCKHIPYGLNENSEIDAAAETADAARAQESGQ